MATPKLVAEAQRLGILPKTEYRRSDYFFQREQSREMRIRSWETPEPLEPSVTTKFFQFWFGFWILFGPFLYVGVFR